MNNYTTRGEKMPTRAFIHFLVAFKTKDMEEDGFDYMENDDYFLDEEDTSMEDLKAAAFEFLLLNPGSEFCDFQNELINEYPTEVVDALGNDLEDVYAEIANLWESDYLDPATCLEKTFEDWALCFSTEQSVDLYYYLVAVIKHQNNRP
jgi:hypothetical protein